MVFQNKALIPALCLMMIIFLIQPAIKKSVVLIAGIGFSGIIIDSLLSLSGLFIFPNNDLIPFWLALLWLSFAMTLPYGFGFIGRLALSLQAVIGMIASLSYLIGLNLGSVEYSNSVVSSQIALAIIWAVFLPVSYQFINRVFDSRL